MGGRLYSRLRTLDQKDVPIFNGTPEDVKDYMRKIDLFELIDGGDPNYKAVRLLAALQGPAWHQAMETLDPNDLCCPDGMLIFKSFILVGVSRV